MIDKRYKAGSTVIREAWKCFSNGDDGALWCRFRLDLLRQGTWLRANTHSVLMADPPWPHTSDWYSRYHHYNVKADKPLPTYTSGFHAFEKQTDAVAYGGIVRQVFVRGVRLVGREYFGRVTSEPFGPVYVSDELFIPSAFSPIYTVPAPYKEDGEL
jgi:hypothetical protein